MLSKEDYAVIKALKKHGVYNKDIAVELGVHPKTVSRAIKRGGPPDKQRRRRSSKLDPYKEMVDQLLGENVWNAMVIFREIQKAGYEGQITLLRDYIRPKRALRPGRATVRFETEPGRQLQSDWGQIVREIAGEERKIHFIVNTLGYSRRFHFSCSEREDAEHTYEGLRRSFEYFVGVTEEVLVDNQKATVLAHQNGHPAHFNERFLDMAGHYGFTPRACQPRRAQTKGKDERMVGYIKDNFFQRYRSFASWAHLNQLAEQWLREEADQRLHGTVKEVVSERFQQELPALQPLPRIPYDTSYRELRRVAWDSYIDVRGNRYSVPAYLVDRVVVVRIGLDESLRVYDGEQLVVAHQLRRRAEGWVTVPEHHTELWQSVLRVEQRPLEVYEEVAAWNS